MNVSELKKENTEEIAIIEKSKPLLDVLQSNWTLNELKVLDIYLSKINARDQDSRTVTFNKGELEKMLGVTYIREEYLTQWFDNLSKFVLITSPDADEKIKISLFERYAWKNKKNGCQEIKLTCTESAKIYFFNIENLHYIQYRLKNILRLNSRYSYGILMYLFNNEYKQEWVVDIATLKNFIMCNSAYYDDFAKFNNKIMKVAQKEINEKTDISFDYVPIREGLRVKYIKFNVSKNTMQPELKGTTIQSDSSATFNQFWNTYPKKENKTEAEEVWVTLNPSDELVNTIIMSVNNWKKTERWKEEGGRYIPQAGKWLQNRRWEDELPKSSSDTHKPSYDSRAYERKAQEVPVYDPKKKK